MLAAEKNRRASNPHALHVEGPLSLVRTRLKLVMSHVYPAVTWYLRYEPILSSFLRWFVFSVSFSPNHSCPSHTPPGAYRKHARLRRLGSFDSCTITHKALGVAPPPGFPPTCHSYVDTPTSSQNVQRYSETRLRPGGAGRQAGTHKEGTYVGRGSLQLHTKTRKKRTITTATSANNTSVQPPPPPAPAPRHHRPTAAAGGRGGRQTTYIATSPPVLGRVIAHCQKARAVRSHPR